MSRTRPKWVEVVLFAVALVLLGLALVTSSGCAVVGRLAAGAAQAVVKWAWLQELAESGEPRPAPAAVVTDQDPRLGQLVEDAFPPYLPLLAGSPAIDAGVPIDSTPLAKKRRDTGAARRPLTVVARHSTSDRANGRAARRTKFIGLALRRRARGQ